MGFYHEFKADSLPRALLPLLEITIMTTGQNSDERADAAAEHTKQYTKASIVEY